MFRFEIMSMRRTWYICVLAVMAPFAGLPVSQGSLQAEPEAGPQAPRSPEEIKRLEKEFEEEMNRARAQQAPQAEAMERELSQAEEIELISLDQGPFASNQERLQDTRTKLEGFPVIETKRLSDRDAIRSLGQALAKGLREVEIRGVPGCFNPRHALRWTKNGHPMMIVVCFDCGNGTSHGLGADDWFFTTKDPREVFGRIFTSAGMTKAKQLEAERQERWVAKQKENAEKWRRKAEMEKQATPTPN